MPLMPLPPAAQNAVEPMQVDPPYEDNDNHHQEHAHLLVHNPTLDLESYANNYTGLARINRLLFVFEVCPPLRLEALKMAISYVMTTYNVTLYQDLHRRLNNLLAEGGAAAAAAPPAANGAAAHLNANAALPDVAAPVMLHMRPHEFPVFDAAWVDAKSKQSALKLEKLDSDLKNFKSNSIKESIRRGHNDLGDHYLSCGDLSNALKCYSRARDYCTSSKHVVNMCLNVIKVSIYLNNWSHVICYVNKAESAPDFEEEINVPSQFAIMQTRVKCSAGIAELMTKKYKAAAKHFLMANFDYCDFTELLSASNVAMYGGLCALATFDRQELLKHIISSSSFKLFLELEPQLRDIIFRFYESKYASCLKLLDDIRDNLLLDMYIAPHVNTLYTKIRNRALVQYFSPYLTVNMRLMAQAFNCSIEALENEMMQLILDGQIQARIDSHNKIMYAKETDHRIATFERTLNMAQDYQRRARMLVLRDAIVRARIYVKSLPRETANEICAVAGSTSATPARNN